MRIITKRKWNEFINWNEFIDVPWKEFIVLSVILIDILAINIIQLFWPSQIITAVLFVIIIICSFIGMMGA